MRQKAHIRHIKSVGWAYSWKFVRFLVRLPSSDFVVQIRHALQKKKMALRTMMTKTGPTVTMRTATGLQM
jgi:hypothetical protein